MLYFIDCNSPGIINSVNEADVIDATTGLLINGGQPCEVFPPFDDKEEEENWQILPCPKFWVEEGREYRQLKKIS